jgi:hypothetical protein
MGKARRFGTKVNLLKIATFKGKCKACREEFPCPHLGDQRSYGSFLFTGEKGTVFAILNALDHPVWDYLESTLPLPKRGLSRQSDCKRGDRIQAACAYFADHINGQRLCNHLVCPSCHSFACDFWDHERTGTIEIGEVSYTNFMSLPDDVRRQRALDFDQTFQLNLPA